MARILGKKGRYVSEQATKKLLRLLLLLYVFGIIVGFLSGFTLGAHRNIITFLALALFFVLWKFFVKKFKSIENEHMNFRKGIVGEAVIGYILEGLPNDYWVIHDLSTSFGNIDHVVIGPTGAYVIDTKNWKGIIGADGNGELLLNGKPTDKPQIKHLTRTIMNMKEKIEVLSGIDPFVQGVLAFPSARVEANWGTTGYIHCVTNERLYDYIVENKKPKKLDKKNIDSISQAFLALARMDKDFETNSK